MQLTIKDITYISLFAGLIAIGAFISIPIGSVPITLQTLFVLLAGIILGPNLGILSLLVYTLLGLVGLPIFSGFTGSIQAIFRPSFGFILGFIVASYIIGLISSSKKIDPSKRVWLASIIGTMVIYLFGLPYMYFILNNIMGMGLSFSAVFKMGCLIFLPGDLIKLVIASLVGIRLQRIIGN